MVHAYRSRGGTRSPPSFSLPILCGACRHHPERQPDNLVEYRCFHRHLWFAVHLHYVGAGHLSAVTLPGLGPGVLQPVCKRGMTHTMSSSSPSPGFRTCLFYHQRGDACRCPFRCADGRETITRKETTKRFRSRARGCGVSGQRQRNSGRRRKKSI